MTTWDQETLEGVQRLRYRHVVPAVQAAEVPRASLDQPAARGLIREAASRYGVLLDAQDVHVAEKRAREDDSPWSPEFVVLDAYWSPSAPRAEILGGPLDGALWQIERVAAIRFPALEPSGPGDWDAEATEPAAIVPYQVYVIPPGGWREEDRSLVYRWEGRSLGQG